MMKICSPLTKKTCDLICGTLLMTSEGNGRSSIPCGEASPGDRNALPASFLMVGSLSRNSLITCPCSLVIWIERLGGGDGCSEGTWPGAFWTNNTRANIPNIKKVFFMTKSSKPIQALLSAHRLPTFIEGVCTIIRLSEKLECGVLSIVAIYPSTHLSNPAADPLALSADGTGR